MSWWQWQQHSYLSAPNGQLNRDTMVHVQSSRRDGANRKSSRSCKWINPYVIAVFFLVCVAFNAGVFMGASMFRQEALPCVETSKKEPERRGVDDSQIEAIVQQRVAAAGIAQVDKTELFAAFDNGFPESHGINRGSEEAFILYSGTPAMPTDAKLQRKIIYDDGVGVPVTDVAKATENCETLNFVTTQAYRGAAQCLVIAGHYESYHVRKWMRKKPGEELQLVGRGYQGAAKPDEFTPPKERALALNRERLQKYLNTLKDLEQDLKPILKRIAKRKTVIVMVCNKGQSDLLMNFVCSSKARGFDISQILLFATDDETQKLATSLGLESYFDKRNFDDMPTEEAKRYGDRAFAAMMYPKDVDIVWYKDPLVAFHDTQSPLHKFDVLFQDDGARSMRYAPYSANSGFYYVRYNPKTQYLLTSLLYHGDMIIGTGSHQQVLAALLTEHNSLFGLSVKVLKGEDFPGGFHFHSKSRASIFKDIATKTKLPYLFHMSWTENKDNKLLFMQQMGMWYVTDTCDSGKAHNLLLEGGTKVQSSEFTNTCCAKEALVTCHYKDKPSIIPCKDSPTIDKKNTAFSFW
eukprot:scaffold26338_cov49-Attheya_sp.AAC.10